MQDKNLHYFYANANRRTSTIECDETTYFPTIKPTAGFTADTRFFAASNTDCPQFVVKRPKFSSSLKENISKSMSGFIRAYKKEAEVWNSVYPNQKAKLITEGGLRLVLPCLPGDTFRNEASDNLLIYCQQFLAVLYALQEFNQLGWCYNDFNIDNVLIKDNLNGTFKAYLIDFDNIDRIEEFNSNSEAFILGDLAYNIPNLRGFPFYEVNSLIGLLKKEIHRLSEENNNSFSI